METIEKLNDTVIKLDNLGALLFRIVEVEENHNTISYSAMCVALDAIDSIIDNLKELETEQARKDLHRELANE